MCPVGRPPPTDLLAVSFPLTWQANTAETRLRDARRPADVGFFLGPGHFGAGKAAPVSYQRFAGTLCVPRSLGLTCPVAVLPSQKRCGAAKSLTYYRLNS
jgi:hypothetical protein